MKTTMDNKKLETTFAATIIDEGLIEVGFTYRGFEPRVEVSGTARVTRDDVEIVQVDLNAQQTRALTTDHLRRLPLGGIRLEIINRVRRGALEGQPNVLSLHNKLARPGEQLPGAQLPGARKFADEIRDHIVGALKAPPFPSFRPNKGRGANSPDFYRGIALQYLRVLEQSPRRVIAAMTEELRAALKEPKLSRNTVSRWVRKAREESWLTRSTRGVPGGEPGSRLVSWIEWYGDPSRTQEPGEDPE